LDLGTSSIGDDWWYTYPSEKYEFVSWDDEIPDIWKNKNGPKHQPDIQLSPLPSDNERHQRWEWNMPHSIHFIHISYIFHTYFIHISYMVVHSNAHSFGDFAAFPLP